MGTITSIKGNPYTDQFRVLRQGIATIPALASPANNTTASPSLYIDVTHNLGFAPVFICYADVPKIDWWGEQFLNKTVQMPIGYVEDSALGGGNSNYYTLTAIADSTKLRIYNNWTTYASAQAIPAIPVRYFLFEPVSGSF